MNDHERCVHNRREYYSAIRGFCLGGRRVCNGFVMGICESSSFQLLRKKVNQVAILGVHEGDHAQFSGLV
jgi:hypothetical protein